MGHRRRGVSDGEEVRRGTDSHTLPDPKVTAQETAGRVVVATAVATRVVVAPVAALVVGAPVAAGTGARETHRRLRT